MLFWFDTYMLNHKRIADPFDIIDTLQNLESGEPRTGIVAASRFKRMPLKGLWHKHYFSARFLAHNIVREWGVEGLEKIINEVMDPRKSDVITEDMIKELAHKLTVAQLENRSKAGRLTGEWVIFAKHEGKNFYLALGIHDWPDQEQYSRIARHCATEFPGLDVFNR